MEADQKELLFFYVYNALASAGEVKRALDLIETHPVHAQGFALADVARRSGSSEVFALLDKKMREDPANFSQDQLRVVLVQALAANAMQPVADALIAQAPADADREPMIAEAAVEHAKAGRTSEALRLALSIADLPRRAWALREVAEMWKG